MNDRECTAKTITGPLGPLWIEVEAGALTRLAFVGERELRPHKGSGADAGPLFTEIGAQLDAYFAGRLRAFDLPLAPRGTPFQEQVWRALARIPYGVTCSYAELAARVGRPSGARAIGAANGRNPIAIVLPCHRVIGASGGLTGYAGGLGRKAWLLAHEGAGQPPSGAAASIANFRTYAATP